MAIFYFMVVDIKYIIQWYSLFKLLDFWDSNHIPLDRDRLQADNPAILHKVTNAHNQLSHCGIYKKASDYSNIISGQGFSNSACGAEFCAFLWSFGWSHCVYFYFMRYTLPCECATMARIEIIWSASAYLVHSCNCMSLL